VMLRLTPVILATLCAIMSLKLTRSKLEIVELGVLVLMNFTYLLLSIENTRTNCFFDM